MGALLHNLEHVVGVQPDLGKLDGVFADAVQQLAREIQPVLRPGGNQAHRLVAVDAELLDERAGRPGGFGDIIAEGVPQGKGRFGDVLQAGLIQLAYLLGNLGHRAGDILVGFAVIVCVNTFEGVLVGAQFALSRAGGGGELVHRLVELHRPGDGLGAHGDGGRPHGRERRPRRFGGLARRAAYLGKSRIHLFLGLV